MEDVAWAAGFFDVEGSINIIRRRKGLQYLHYQLNLNAPQINKDALLKLQELFGGVVRLNKQYENRRQSFTWTLHSRKADHALTTMLPYLIVKKQEAELALRFRIFVKSNARQRLTDWDHAERASFGDALREYHKTYEYEGLGG